MSEKVALTAQGAPPQYGQPMQPGYQNQTPPGYNAGYNQPVTGQPGYGHPGTVGATNIPGGTQVVQWMAKPDGIAGCPPGLEYLTQIDQILVKQQIDVIELLTSWEQANKYRLLNSMGQQIYFASEESNVCERQCCHGNRSFTMHITDNAGMEVIRAVREFRCWKDSCWCACVDCCAHLIAIEAPVGQVVGYVKQRCSPCPPRYGILDSDMNEVMTVNGPCCICRCVDVDFNIVSARDGVSEVGKVTKQFSGVFQEFFTSADNFGISFPMDLDVKMKAVMIGAVFLIDFMYFEQQKNSGSH